MSKESERLLESLSHLPDRPLDEAVDFRRPRRRPRAGVLAAAACLVLVIGAGIAALPWLVGGRSAAPGGGAGTGSGTAGHDESTVFLHYAGPVLPLTAAEDTAVTAQRTVTLDFAPWEPVWVSNEDMAGGDAAYLEQLNEWNPEGGRYVTSDDILVTDEYVLTNPTAADETLTVYYPFAGSLNMAGRYVPTVTAGGTALETELLAGGYSGGFAPAYGAEAGDEALLNLSPAGWEDYRALLASDGYLAGALAGDVDLSGIPAVVYAFTDYWGPEEGDDAPSPTIRASYEMDYEQTVVLSHGFNGGSYDPGAGVQARSFSIPQPGERGYGRTFYLIVLGDDIANLELTCYSTGGWDTEAEAEGGAAVTRTETNLAAALEPVIDTLYGDIGWEAGAPMEGNEELYAAAFRRQLAAYVLAEDAPARYGEGMLENLDVVNVSRILYLAAEVTVPAGGQLTVTAELRKEASYDFDCAHTENRGVRGYDLLTEGNHLTITSQTAALEDWGQISIVRQNFGFDLAAGVRTVTLDPAQPHYYLEVRRVDP